MALPLLAVAGLSGIGKGIASLFGNKGANAQIDYANAQSKYKRDLNQGALTRRASLIGSTLRKLAEHPEVYGKYISPDMFGYLPGSFTEGMLTLPQAPQLKKQSGLSSFLGGLIGGAGDVLGSRAMAGGAFDARVGSGIPPELIMSMRGGGGVGLPGSDPSAGRLAFDAIRRTGGMEPV